MKCTATTRRKGGRLNHLAMVATEGDGGNSSLQTEWDGEQGLSRRKLIHLSWKYTVVTHLVSYFRDTEHLRTNVREWGLQLHGQQQLKAVDMGGKLHSPQQPEAVGRGGKLHSPQQPKAVDMGGKLHSPQQPKAVGMGGKLHSPQQPKAVGMGGKLHSPQQPKAVGMRGKLHSPQQPKAVGMRGKLHSPQQLKVVGMGGKAGAGGGVRTLVVYYIPSTRTETSRRMNTSDSIDPYAAYMDQKLTNICETDMQ